MPNRQTSLVGTTLAILIVLFVVLGLVLAHEFSSQESYKDLATQKSLQNLQSFNADTSGEIGLLLELHGVMECLVAEESAKKGAVVKARWRPGRMPMEAARSPIALRDVKQGDAVMLVALNSGKSIIFPSELCKGALEFEITQEMRVPDDLFSEIP